MIPIRRTIVVVVLALVGGVAAWLIHRSQEFIQPTRDQIALELQLDMFGLVTRGNSSREFRFIHIGVVTADRIGLDILNSYLTSQRQDRRGILSTAEKNADWHVTFEMIQNCVAQDVGYIHLPVVIRSGRKIPVSFFGDLPSLPTQF